MFFSLSNFQEQEWWPGNLSIEPEAFKWAFHCDYNTMIPGVRDHNQIFGSPLCPCHRPHLFSSIFSVASCRKNVLPHISDVNLGRVIFLATQMCTGVTCTTSEMGASPPITATHQCPDGTYPKSLDNHDMEEALSQPRMDMYVSKK